MNGSRPVVVVVGAGNLGSRHLQGLARVNFPMALFAVDPWEQSRRVAQARFEAIPGHEAHTLQMLERVEDLPSRIDLVIVSTSANVRYEMIQRIVAVTQVRTWVLEKILFQREEHYRAIQSLVPSGSAAWVNCAQRLWPFFLALRDEARSGVPMQIEMFGSNWGLASNAIHNLDIAEFFWGPDLATECVVDGRAIASKRAGFQEFNGWIETRSKSGLVRQVSLNQGQHPFTISCQTEMASLVWDVVNGLMIERRAAAGWKPVVSAMTAPFQSTLTATVAEEILGTGRCTLPTLTESVATHLHLFAAVKKAAPEIIHEANGLFPFT